MNLWQVRHQLLAMMPALKGIADGIKVEVDEVEMQKETAKSKNR